MENNVSDRLSTYIELRLQHKLIEKKIISELLEKRTTALIEDVQRHIEFFRSYGKSGKTSELNLRSKLQLYADLEIVDQNLFFATLHDKERNEFVKIFSEHDLYLNEKNWLLKINASTYHLPIIRGHNDEVMEIRYDYPGEPLSQQNMPKDWEKQLQAILNQLKSLNCNHGAFFPENIFVQNGTLSLVNFHEAIDRNLDIINFSGVKFYDDDVCNLFEYLYVDCSAQGELHTIVLWDLFDEEEVLKQILGEFDLVQRIKYDQKFFENTGGTTHNLNKVYKHSRHSYNQKGKRPFKLFLVHDKKVDYEMVLDGNSQRFLTVNKKLHSFKIKARNGRQGYLHASNNLEEARDALDACQAGIYSYPKLIYTKRRPKFQNLGEVFDTLERNGISYVVLRNFEMLPDEYIIDEHGDIDLLVDDYFNAKRVLGGECYKHLLDKRDSRYGPPYDVGGHKIANKIQVNNSSVELDIRFVGDGYYDKNWQTKILENRVKTKGFYRPNDGDHVYSLIYHALLHKYRISDTYFRVLEGYEHEAASRLSSPQDLFHLLARFMDDNDYKYTLPLEKNIKFNSQNWPIIVTN